MYICIYIYIYIYIYLYIHRTYLGLFQSREPCPRYIKPFFKREPVPQMSGIEKRSKGIRVSAFRGLRVQNLKVSGFEVLTLGFHRCCSGVAFVSVGLRACLKGSISLDVAVLASSTCFLASSRKLSIRQTQKASTCKPHCLNPKLF